MSTKDEIEQAVAILARDAAARVTREGNALSLGFHSISGRLMPIVVRATSTNKLLVSDDGETWWGLVTANAVNATPDRNDARRLEELARLYGVMWNYREHALECLCDLGDVADAARRLTMASIALDSWRVWVPTDDAVVIPKYKRIVNQIRELAPLAGLSALPIHHVVGKSGHKWRTSVVLSRDSRRAAVTRAHKNADVTIERLVGWSNDTGMPAVVVADSKIVEVVERTAELFGKPIAFVVSDLDTAPHRVVQQANRLLKDAA